MEENCGGRETEDGFCHLDGGCHCCGKQSRMEETNQWPYSPRGEVGTKSSKSSWDIMCALTRKSPWFYFVIPPKNVKNVINRFYRSELRNRCGFVLYCLTAAERFDQGNTS